MYRNGLYHDAVGNRTHLEYNDGGRTTTTTYLYNPPDQLTREHRKHGESFAIHKTSGVRVE